MKNIILLLTLILAMPAFAIESMSSLSADDFAGRINAEKTGNHDHVTGASQKMGYTVGFEDEKNANLHIWGLGRLYFYPDSNGSRVNMGYFRLYFDGQKDEEFSFRVRADYNPNMAGYFASSVEQDSDVVNSPSIYFGRAFVTYSPKKAKNWSFKIGRILNQVGKYDVFGRTHLDSGDKGIIPGGNVGQPGGSAPGWLVADGVDANYRNGSFSARMVATYRGADGDNDGEEFLYGGRIANSTSLGKKVGTFAYGLAATTKTHHTSEPNYVELMPDLSLFGNGWYMIDQVYLRKAIDGAGGFNASDYKLLARNYIEVGSDFQAFGKTVAMDTYLSTAYYDKYASSEVGIETFIYLPSSVMVGIIVDYENIFNERGNNDSNPLNRMSSYIMLNKYF